MAGRRESPDAPRPHPGTERTFWFGAELVPDSRQVWFRITEEAIARIPAETPTARGQHLVNALILRMMMENRPLRCGINRFEVRVSETGEAWVERLRW